MKTLLTAVGLTIAALAPWPAMARSDVSVSIGFGLPVYVSPEPVYYAPPPPPPRYYYAPRPVAVYSAPYYGPRYRERVVVRDRHYYHDHGHDHRHDRGHGRDDRRYYREDRRYRHN